MISVDAVCDFEAGLYPGIAPGLAMERLAPVLRQGGFDVLTYDYSPVPLTRQGELILPNVLELYRAPREMSSLWCEQGYYCIDPVMEVAVRYPHPFAWSHDGRQSHVMRDALEARHAPVVDYLRDTHMSCGITVPIHHGGALATFTAIRRGSDDDLERYCASIGYLGHLFHAAVHAGFDSRQRRCRYFNLTPRELQCLRLCAEGLTTRQIAAEIWRSEPTVALHLNSAIRKLGGRNRTHAVAIAGWYRLLECEACEKPIGFAS